MSKKVLFVDDETRVLDGLQRMLRPFRGELDMEFASSGEAALKLMSERKFDIVVSDIRMPGMGGAELLERVKNEYPDTIRFALSGQSDQETWMRAVGSAHQFLSKPCSAERLRGTILQATSLRERLRSEPLRNLVSGTMTLPSLPRLYGEIMSLMQKPEVSVGELASAVEGDVAMSAKVLQLVNSAAMGLHSHVSSPAQAVTLLGLGTLRALVLFVHVFESLNMNDGVVVEFMESFNSHSLAVSQCARKIAAMETHDKNLIQESSIAGMLHDIGRIMFASHFHKSYKGILKSCPDEGLSLVEAEIAEFGASHQDVGAYLLAIWGLSDPIVEAVAYHHTPLMSGGAFFSPLAAIHAADSICSPLSAFRKDGDPLPVPSGPDSEFIARLGLQAKVDAWRQAAATPASTKPEPQSHDPQSMKPKTGAVNELP